MSRAVVAVGDEARLARLVEEDLAAAPRRLHRGWPEKGNAGVVGTLYHGVVRDASDAMRALLAVVAGADIVAVVPAWTPEIDRFLDDLRRIADVEVRTEIRDHDATGGGRLSAEDRAILDAYAAGLRRLAVARETNRSPRSLDRRVADIKRRLGARSIAHAIELVKRGGDR